MKINPTLSRCKILIITLCLIMSAAYTYSAQVTLTDGRILHGKLTGIGQERIYLDGDNGHCYIKQNDITAVTADTDNDATEITVSLRSGRTINADLVMLTADTLIYKTANSLDTLHYINRNEIMRIGLNNDTQNHSDSVQIASENNDDILTATVALLGVSSGDTSIGNIESSDFYDKYWLRFNGHIDKSTGNLLWNLIDIYTDKEKNLTLIYNELLSNDKDKTEIKMSAVSQELQSRIHRLRLEFSHRAYKIIVRSFIAHDPQSDFEVSYGVVL